MIVQTMPYPPNTSAGISYVGGAKGFQSSTGSLALNGLTGGIGTSPANGDFAIVVVSCSSATAASITSSGWTTLYYAATQDPTAGIRLQILVAYKALTTADTSVGFNNVAMTYAAQVFRGVDNSTPLDVTSVTSIVNDAPQPNPGSITPVTAGAWVVACGASHGAFNANVFTSSDLTNFISEVNAPTGTDPVVGIGYIPDWESGAVNPAQFGGGSTANPTWCSSGQATIALRPA